LDELSQRHIFFKNLSRSLALICSLSLSLCACVSHSLQSTFASSVHCKREQICSSFNKLIECTITTYTSLSNTLRIQGDVSSYLFHPLSSLSASKAVQKNPFLTLQVFAAAAAAAAVMLTEALKI